MNNTFSVVIPTHMNRGKLTQRAIRSITSQTYPYWECLVVDNHSTDDIKSIIGSFKDFRIHYIKSEGNRYFARNAGMNIALHDWICWLDSDDEYESIYFEAINNAINEFSQYKCFNFATLVQHNKKQGQKELYKYSTVRQTFKPPEEGEGHRHFESGKIGAGQFVFHRSVYKEIGPMPETHTWWDFATVAKIPGYGADKRPLGNPWGEDYYYFYKITRKFKSKPLDLILYIQHTR